VEAHAPLRAGGVDAIEHEGVAVEVQIERVGEALRERDGAALAARKTPLCTRPPAQRGEDRAYEDGEDGARQARVLGEPVAEPEGQGEHPRADGHFGQYPLDQAGRRVGHAPASA
jgi:hypothetical protein